jgi:glycosyltransferase involved in cell wall biosynthesis
MKIGYFVSDFPYKNPLTGKKIKSYVTGGVGNAAYNLAVQMANRGHNIFIFTSSDSKDSIEEYGKIKIYRYKSNFKIGQAPIPFGLVYKPLLSKLDLDIVHAHMGNLPAPITAFLYSQIIEKKPFIVTHHGDWIGGYGGVIRRFGVFLFNKYICDLILSNTDKIIGLSDSHIKNSRFLQKYIFNVFLIPNGINQKEFEVPLSKEECRKKLRLPLDKKLILFVGFLAPIKSPQVLLKSMLKVSRQIPSSHLIFVGEGEMKKLLMEESEKLGLKNCVKFTGFIDEDKALYYKSADLFVLPSLSEAFPLSLLEASVSGLPLVVSDLEVFRSIVQDEYNGMFTRTGDAEDLADKIIYLLENENVRNEMGKNAKSKIGNFSWEEIANKTAGLYTSLVDHSN